MKEIGDGLLDWLEKIFVGFIVVNFFCFGLGIAVSFIVLFILIIWGIWEIISESFSELPPTASGGTEKSGFENAFSKRFRHEPSR